MFLAIVHLLVNLPLGVAYFTLLATGVSLGLGLLITLLGIPVLIGTGWLVRALGNIERARINTFLGTTLRDPYRPAAPEAGWIGRLFAVGADPAVWRDFLFLILRLPMGLLTFTVTVTIWALGVGLLGSPVAYLFGVFRMNFGDFVFDGPLAVVLATLAGVVVLVLAVGITKGLAALDVVMAGALLDASPDELKRRVTEIAGSRTRSVSAADQERRRLERDLHDGAQ
jgi:signal transduction histidine kinase